MVDVVKALAPHFALAVMSSNSMDAIRRILETAGVAQCFAHVFSAEVGTSKREHLRRVPADPAYGGVRQCSPDYLEGCPLDTGRSRRWCWSPTPSATSPRRSAAAPGRSASPGECTASKRCWTRAPSASSTGRRRSSPCCCPGGPDRAVSCACSTAPASTVCLPTAFISTASTSTASILTASIRDDVGRLGRLRHARRTAAVTARLPVRHRLRIGRRRAQLRRPTRLADLGDRPDRAPSAMSQAPSHSTRTSAFPPLPQESS